MRHRKKNSNLSRTSSSRNLLIRNLTKELIDHGEIVTTTVKAKEVKRYAERIFHIAKKSYKASQDGDKAKAFAYGRLIQSRIADKRLTVKVINEVAPKIMDREGGYTSVYKLKNRRGDGAEISLLRVVTSTK
jgi:large subunit ribosomal protein L17